MCGNIPQNAVQENLFTQLSLAEKDRCKIGNAKTNEVYQKRTRFLVNQVGEIIVCEIPIKMARKTSTERHALLPQK